MKTKEQIEQEVKELEEQLLERIRQGYTTLKYAPVFRLQALKWVLQDTQVETKKEYL